MIPRGMKPMIDIHTHILPGMDDGARDVRESLAMIDLLKKQGVAGAVLTPHYYAHREPLEEFLWRRQQAFEEISFIEDFSLFLGSETYLSETLLSNESLQELCLGDGNHLLLEMPYLSKWGATTYRLIEHIIEKYQVTPIIPHVERYEASSKNLMEIMERLVNMGCLLQFNLESFIEGWPGPRKMQKIFSQGWADFLASDCHNLTRRPPLWDREIFKKSINDIPMKKGWNMADRMDEVLF